MRIRSRSLIIMFSRGLTKATGLIIAVILVRVISKEMLGSYRQVMLAYLVISGLLSLQLGTSLYYFVPKLGVPRQRALLAQTLTMTLVLALLMGSAMFICAGPIARAMNNPEIEPLLRIFALYPFVDQAFALIPAFLISVDRPVRAGVYTLARVITHGVVVVAAFSTGCSIFTVLCIAMPLEGVVTAIGVADMARLTPKGLWRIRGDLIKEQLSYTWPLLATAIVATLNLQFGKLLISVYFDPEVYAVYSCGAIEVPMLALVTTSIAAAMMPNLVRLAKEGKTQAAVHLWQEATRKCSLIVFPCFAFLFCVAQDFIVVLYGTAYAMAVWPFAIYLLMLPLRVAVYATLFRAAGHTRPIAVSALIGLSVNAVLSAVLVWAGQQSLLSYIGPAIGAVASTMVMVVYLLIRLGKTMDLPVAALMRWRELGQTLGISVFCGVLVFVLPVDGLSIPLRLAVRGLVFLTAYVALLLARRTLQTDELEMLYWPWRTARRLLAREPRS